jgi:hypothetical protein
MKNPVNRTKKEEEKKILMADPRVTKKRKKKLNPPYNKLIGRFMRTIHQTVKRRIIWKIRYFLL